VTYCRRLYARDLWAHPPYKNKKNNARDLWAPTPHPPILFLKLKKENPRADLIGSGLVVIHFHLLLFLVYLIHLKALLLQHQ